MPSLPVYLQPSLGATVEIQHHSRSNRVSLFPLEYTWNLAKREREMSRVFL